MHSPGLDWRSLASAAIRNGDLAQAEEIYRTNLCLAPDDPFLRYGLSWVLLSRGEWAEAWPLYEARHQIPELNAPKPPLPFAEWHGQSLSGARILIWPDQGLGDQIMFARYAPWMRDQGADVTLVCPPVLAELFATSFEGVRIVPSAGAAEFPTPTYWVMSSSLAGRAGHGPQDIPSQPYLVAKASPDASGGIGVMARGNPAHKNNANRSLDPIAEARLHSLPGAISLHPADTGFTNFLETARLVAGLREVISVDTAVAHLAGAMGKQVTTLVTKHEPDWRWQNAADGRPWYPIMRILRQTHANTWTSELDQLESLASI